MDLEEIYASLVDTYDDPVGQDIRETVETCVEEIACIEGYGWDFVKVLTKSARKILHDDSDAFSPRQLARLHAYAHAGVADTSAFDQGRVRFFNVSRGKRHMLVDAGFFAACRYRSTRDVRLGRHALGDFEAGIGRSRFRSRYVSAVRLYRGYLQLSLLRDGVDVDTKKMWADLSFGRWKKGTMEYKMLLELLENPREYPPTATIINPF